MKALALIIGAAVVILLLGAVISAINDFQTTDVQEPYNITTGGGITTADIILSQELFGDNTISATVTSNFTADAPVPSTYDSSTQTLTITGLVESESRRLTIDYKTDGLWNFPGAGVATRMWPIMLVLGVIGLIAGAVIVATRHGGD